MSAKSILLSTAAVAVTAWAGSAFAADLAVVTKAPPPPADSPWFIVNDNSVSFTWYPSATDPGVPGGGVAGNSNTFSKFVGEVTHFDVWQYGTNFIDVNFIKSTNANPVGDVFKSGATGAVEVFAVERSTLGLNQLTNSKMFSNFLVKNIELEAGINANTENDGVNPQLTAPMAGLQFDLNLPGTVNLSVLAYKEYNNNSYWITTDYSGAKEYNVTPRFELLVAEPLTFLPWPVSWHSFTAVTLPKGTGISTAHMAELKGGVAGNIADAETKVEVFEDNRIVLDASKLWFNKPGKWDLYAGYRYWYNKFGTDHNAPLFSTISPGTSVESTAYVGTTLHF